jgi:transcriptional regulator with XRE-family HTH domain
MIIYAIEGFANALKAARKKKGINQTQLGLKVGLPQSHISKIEKGATDLKLSSLIEIARVLDLELILVPRKLVPTVQSILRTAGDVRISPSAGQLRIEGHPVTVRSAAYSTDEDEDDA